MMRDQILAVVFVVLAAALAMPGFGTAGSLDFLALWMAGEAVANGTPALIYPPDTGVFTMTPPPEWLETLAARGHDDPVYPFIYPPLWAWLMAPVTQVTTFETATVLLRGALAALLAGTLLAARRLAAPDSPLLPWLAAGVMMLMLTTTGMIALFQNQPQILVAFLTVLALERAGRGVPVPGGALMALAAAIKLYPALLALLWLARGQYRAFGAFLVTGGALAGLSVAVAGWPLHARFLDLIGMISGTVLSASQSHTTDVLFAQILWPFQFSFIEDITAETENGWLVLEKSAGFAAFGKGLQLATLAALAWAGRRGMVAAAFWPLAMVALSLTGPLAWSYHYIAPLAFAPMLLARREATARRVFLAVFALISLFWIRVPSVPFWPWIPAQFAGTVAMLIYAGALIALARHAGFHPAPTSPLRPGPGTL